MAKTLAERLRDCAQGLNLGADGIGWNPDPELLKQAADKIDGLHAELKYARDGLTKGRTRMREDMERLRVENAELKRHATAAVAAERRWRETVDDMLSVCHMVAGDDPRESINRLINWHCSVHIDPAVSSAAAELVTAAVAAAVPQWRPIETAPKDTSVLLSDGHSVGEGFWHDGSQCYGHRGGAGWFWESDRGDLLIASNAHATHWMPLPAAPEVPR